MRNKMEHFFKVLRFKIARCFCEDDLFKWDMFDHIIIANIFFCMIGTKLWHSLLSTTNMEWSSQKQILLPTVHQNIRNLRVHFSDSPTPYFNVGWHRLQTDIKKCWYIWHIFHFFQHCNVTTSKFSGFF